MTPRKVAEQLRGLLPEHTFRAVMQRAKALGSDRERLDLLRHILEERERGEALDRQWIAS